MGSISSISVLPPQSSMTWTSESLLFSQPAATRAARGLNHATDFTDFSEISEPRAVFVVVARGLLLPLAFLLHLTVLCVQLLVARPAAPCHPELPLQHQHACVCWVHDYFIPAPLRPQPALPRPAVGRHGRGLARVVDTFEVRLCVLEAPRVSSLQTEVIAAAAAAAALRRLRRPPPPGVTTQCSSSVLRIRSSALCSSGDTSCFSSRACSIGTTLTSAGSRTSRTYTELAYHKPQ
jgi:hypothetical protein